MSELLLNKRQKKALAALRTTKTYIYQNIYDNNARWYVWHPEHFSVRLSLTCKDVNQLNLFCDDLGHRKLS